MNKETVFYILGVVLFISLLLTPAFISISRIDENLAACKEDYKNGECYLYKCIAKYTVGIEEEDKLKLQYEMCLRDRIIKENDVNVLEREE